MTTAILDPMSHGRNWVLLCVLAVVSWAPAVSVSAQSACAWRELSELSDARGLRLGGVLVDETGLLVAGNGLWRVDGPTPTPLGTFGPHQWIANIFRLPDGWRNAWIGIGNPELAFSQTPDAPGWIDHSPPTPAALIPVGARWVSTDAFYTSMGRLDSSGAFTRMTTDEIHQVTDPLRRQICRDANEQPSVWSSHPLSAGVEIGNVTVCSRSILITRPDGSVIRRLPQSRTSHVSAFALTRSGLVLGQSDAALWVFDGTSWSRRCRSPIVRHASQIAVREREGATPLLYITSRGTLYSTPL